MEGEKEGGRGREASKQFWRIKWGVAKTGRKEEIGEGPI